MEALRVEGLSKNFGALPALRNVSFSVEEGERLAIIGPNGAGKTTLLNVINGQLSATAGKIYFYGKEITNLPVYRCARMGQGRSFQITSLFPNLAVIHNTLLSVPVKQRVDHLIFRPITADKHSFARAGQLLESIGLWEKRDELVQTLSHGEQRKLEIALTLASGSKLLLLDEPSSGLTSAESADIVEMIRNLGTDVTVILVAHDMDLVFGVAERIIVLHYGEIVAEGTCDEISCDLKVREIYMGSEDI